MAHAAFSNDDTLDLSLWDTGLVTRLFGEHDVVLDPTTLETTWPCVSPDDGLIPPHLMEVLFRIHDLSNDAGHEALLTLLDGPDLDDEVARYPADLALVAWLEHRSVFERVHAQHVTQSLSHFRAFRGRSAGPIPFGEHHQRALERGLAPAFDRRGRGSYCRVTVLQDGGEFDVVVDHGQPSRRIGVIPSAAHGPDRAWAVHPRQTDELFYDADTGLLHVLAPDATTVRMYRRALGLLLFDDVEWFGDEDILSLEPLIEHERGALIPVPGLRKVQLRAIELRLAHPFHEAMVGVQGLDVFAVLDHYGRVRMTDGELVSAQLALAHESGGRPRSVQLQLPNAISFDRRRGARTTLRFLEERGFLRGATTRRTE